MCVVCITKYFFTVLLLIIAFSVINSNLSYFDNSLMQPCSNTDIKAHTASNSSSLSSPIRSAFHFSPLLPYDPPIHTPLLPSLIICPPPALSFFLFTFPILPHDLYLPLQLLSSIISPVDIYVLPTSLLISPVPPPPPRLLLSLSGRCVPLLLLSSCSCGPSSIIDHFDCDTDHFCLSPFLPLSHPEGKLSHYVPHL